MFKISAIQDKTRQKEMCDLFDTTFIPDAFAYLMYDADTSAPMGMSQFEIGTSGYIYDIREIDGRDDFGAMFILIRATMNFIDMCGAHICKAASNASAERLLISAGFKKDGEEYFCDMTGMFDGHCGGKK